MNNEYFSPYNIIDVTKFKNYINNTCDKIIINIKKKHKKLKWIVPYINYFNSNQYLFFIIILISIIIFSKFLLNILLLLLLFDCIILSIIVLHKTSLQYYSRKLAKNIILLALIYFNLFGNIFTLLIFLFLHFEFSKYCNKIIYKVLEAVIMFINTNISVISLIYPNINNIKYNTTIESTDNTSSGSSKSS
jgi:hypothetical protein